MMPKYYLTNAERGVNFLFETGDSNGDISEIDNPTTESEEN